MELWEVLDDKGNPTGEIMEKYDKRVFDKGLYHLGSDVWIINSENKILIQKRSENKYFSKIMWHFLVPKLHQLGVLTPFYCLGQNALIPFLPAGREISFHILYKNYPKK